LRPSAPGQAVALQLLTDIERATVLALGAEKPGDFPGWPSAVPPPIAAQSLAEWLHRER